VADLSKLDRVPVVPLTASLWWRHCYIPRDPAQQDPLRVSARTPSRWKTDEGTLYLADRPTTAWCEYLRNTAEETQLADPTGGIGFASRAEVEVLAADPLNVVPRGLWRVDVHFDRVADFTSPAALDALDSAGVPAADLLADDYGACPSIAREYMAFRWQAVCAPSAALRGGSCVGAFAGAHPPRVLWRQVEIVAVPSIIHAYVTRYRSGERPTWLPA
jgi:hypothetical protein